MVDEFLSEKEQIEAMRSWWQDNGRYVIGGVVLGVAILVGWNQWKEYRQATRLEASALYETLAEKVTDGNLEESESAARKLYESYSSTIYSGLARLAMARLYMDKGRDQDAADTLNALLEARVDSDIRMVGRLRLARVYLYQNKAQQVIDLLQGFEDSAFAARYAELVGDAHAELGQVGEAADSYARAMRDDPEAPTVNRALIQMKIADLPEPAATDTPPGAEPETEEEPSASPKDDQ